MVVFQGFYNQHRGGLKQKEEEEVNIALIELGLPLKSLPRAICLG